MKAGAFDIIQKPVAPKALVNTLRKKGNQAYSAD